MNYFDSRERERGLVLPGGTGRLPDGLEQRDRRRREGEGAEGGETVHEWLMYVQAPFFGASKYIF